MDEQIQHVFPKKIASSLETLHFHKNEKGGYSYASGSISNYIKMTVYPPRLMTSVQDEKLHMACYVEYESYQEPGYIECDWQYIANGPVKIDNLIEFCAKKTAQFFKQY